MPIPDLSVHSNPDLRFGRLPEASPADIMRLMNDPKVRSHLPLLRSDFDDAMCARFVAAKEAMWLDHGYGPWAFFRGSDLVGWGGLQPEGDDVDVGMILNPNAWGFGRMILHRSLGKAFDELQAPSVIALLPLSRVRLRALTRIGFESDGSLEVSGVPFRRFRLTEAIWRSRCVRPPT